MKKQTHHIKLPVIPPHSDHLLNPIPHANSNPRKPIYLNPPPSKHPQPADLKLGDTPWNRSKEITSIEIDRPEKRYQNLIQKKLLPITPLLSLNTTLNGIYSRASSPQNSIQDKINSKLQNNLSIQHFLDNRKKSMDHDGKILETKIPEKDFKYFKRNNIKQQKALSLLKAKNRTKKGQKIFREEHRYKSVENSDSIAQKHCANLKTIPNKIAIKLDVPNIEIIQSQTKSTTSKSRKLTNSLIIRGRYAKIKRLPNNPSDQEIYKCIDLENNSIRCIKILPLSLFVSPQDQETVSTHLELIVQSQISQLVPLYNYFFEQYFFQQYQKKQNCLFLVTEHYECGCLSDFIGKLDISDLIKLYQQIRSIIQTLHKEDLSHGSINRFNIFLDKNMKCFMSIPLINYTHQNKPMFLNSRKELEIYYSYNKLIDPYSNYDDFSQDLWSIGIILLELVCEAPIEQILKHDWIKLPAFNQQFPEDHLKNLSKNLQLKQSILHLLQSNPSKRIFIDVPSLSDSKYHSKPKTKLQRYRLLKKLRSGGQGEIYSCLDTIQSIIKIIKIMPIQDYIDHIQIDYKKNNEQGEILSKLNHPNVIQIYEYFYDVFTLEKLEIRGKCIFIVEQFIEGGDLSNFIGVLSNSHILSIYNDVKNALEYSHSLGIIHRDISLDNILLDSNLKAIITDFGIASLSQDIKSGQFTPFGAGKDIYRSYQLLELQKVYDKTDLWAFGIVLLQLIYGKHLAQFRKKSCHLIPSLDPIFPKLELQQLNTHVLIQYVQPLLKKNVQDRHFFQPLL